MGVRCVTVNPIRLDEIPNELFDSLGTVKNIYFPSQGHTSDVGIVESTRGRYVLKRTKGEQYCSWLSREVHALKCLSGTSLPIPAVYQAVEQKNENQAWALLQYFEGETLREALFKEKNTDRRHEMIYNFGVILSTIHSTPCPKQLVGDFVWLDEMLVQAEYNFNHYVVDGTEDLLQFLKANKPEPIPNTLIHGDFNTSNVLVSAGKITSVIDWSGAGFGDPRYDMSLAIRPKPNIFEIQSEIDIFFEGYGTNILGEREYKYFNEGLYEFF